MVGQIFLSVFCFQISLVCSFHSVKEQVLYLYKETCRIADPVAAWSEAWALIACTLDCGFESCLRHGCLPSSFYVVLSCVGR
jgi:hypothetical protein